MNQLTLASRHVLVAIFAAFMLVIVVYVLRGVINGEIFTLDAQAWIHFASFVGMLIAPIAGLGAAIVVALQLGFSGRVTQLELLQRHCNMLDKEIERILLQPFKNSRHEKYLGMPLKDVVYSLNNAQKEAPDDIGKALNALLQNIAMFLEVVAEKRELTKKLETSTGGQPWAEYSEKLYWVFRYGVIIGRLCRAIGYEKVTSKLTPRQLKLCAELSSEFDSASESESREQAP